MTNINNDYPINQKLVDIILEKDKKIIEKDNKINELISKTESINENNYDKNEEVLDIKHDLKIETNLDKIINEKEQYKKELELKNQKIKLLENLCKKRQKRKDYPEKNVIYILTTEENKKNNTYIIGKAKELKSRLSTYNKSCEHEVIYFKECKNEEDLDFIEKMIIKKLEFYKEQFNRDRFILPIDKEISFFIDKVNECIDFFN